MVEGEARRSQRTTLGMAALAALLAVCSGGGAGAKEGRHWWVILGPGDDVRAEAQKCAVRKRLKPLPHRVAGRAPGTFALGPYADRGMAVAQRRLARICLPKARIGFSAR